MGGGGLSREDGSGWGGVSIVSLCRLLFCVSLGFETSGFPLILRMVF